MDVLGISLAVLITGGLFTRHLFKERRYKEEQRGAAENAFNSLSMPSVDRRFQFEGWDAQVIDEKEGVEQMRGVFLAYTLTRIARNASGEYFWFYFRTASPSQLRHIDQSRAAFLLKGKYLAPPSDERALQSNG